MASINSHVINNKVISNTINSRYITKMSVSEDGGFKSLCNIKTFDYPWSSLNKAFNFKYTLGGVTVLGAKPGCGKTFLSAQICYSIIGGGHRVGFVSFETSISHLQEIFSFFLGKKECFSSHKEHIGSVNKLCNNLMFCDGQGGDSSEVFSMINELVSNGCDLIVIDYIQPVGSKKLIDELMKFIENVSRCSGVSFLVTSQIKKAASRDDQFSCTLSSHIEQKADVVIFAESVFSPSSSYLKGWKWELNRTLSCKYSKVIRLLVSKSRFCSVNPSKFILIGQRFNEAKYTDVDLSEFYLF